MSSNEKMKIEEMVRLSEELSQLRSELQAISQSMKKIEKRISFAFPDYKEIVNRKVVDKTDTKNRKELLNIFELLLEESKKKGDIGFSVRIKDYSIETIIALALELGVPGSSKMGINKAVNGIRNRIQESMMLS